MRALEPQARGDIRGAKDDDVGMHDAEMVLRDVNGIVCEGIVWVVTAHAHSTPTRKMIMTMAVRDYPRAQLIKSIVLVISARH